MDTQLLKLFHGYGDIFDNPKARSFMCVYKNVAGTKDSLLLVNQTNPHCNLCDWIASEDVDLGKCKRAFRPNLPVVVNAPAGVSVSCGKREKSIIGSGAVLETDNTTAFEACPSGFHRLEPEDARLFDAIENDYSEFNIVEQIRDFATHPADGECFGIFADTALAAIAGIAKLRGSMFADSHTISGIFTVQPYRKKGLATALLRSILQAYHSKRFYYTANPATNTASVHLALQCGFVPVGEITTYQFK